MEKAMLIFGYEKRDEFEQSYSKVPLSSDLVGSVAKSFIYKLFAHLAVAMVLLYALYDALEKVSGISAFAIHSLAALVAFYVFGCVMVIWIIARAMSRAMREASDPRHNENDESRRAFWRMQTNLFPPDWR
jgi:predicted PurR-regulated permease PerM